MSSPIYYVYLYICPDSREPFYVGMGKGNRLMYHLNEAKKNLKPVRGQCKLNKIRKILRSGRQPLIETVGSNLSRQGACDLEEFLINHYGRRDLGLGPPDESNQRRRW